MSVAPVPAILPKPSPAKPGLVPKRPKRPANTGIWVGIALAVVMVVSAVIFQTRKQANAPAQATPAAVRTVRVAPGAVRSTVRLTGVTAASSFVSLVTPQLRGSRTDKLRDASTS